MKRQSLLLQGGQRLGLVGTPRAPGVSKGRSFVLLHGLGDNAATWLGLGPALAALGDVVAIELPGHGGSGLGAMQALSLPGMADAVHQALEVLALPQPVLVGHSLGAAVAETLAARSPGDFEALVSVDHAVDLPPATLTSLREGLLAAHRPYTSPAAYAAVLMRRHPCAAPGLLEQVAAASLRPCAQGWVPAFDPAAVAALAAPAPARLHEAHRDVLAGLDLPVLVVRGAWSWLLAQNSASQMVAACPQGELAIVARAGHGVPLDNPAGLGTAIVGFLARLSHARRASTLHCGKNIGTSPMPCSRER